MVRAGDLRVGDEVPGYGVLTRVAHSSHLTTVSSSRHWVHAPGVQCDAWPRGALVPVVRAPRKWRRTVVIEHDEPVLPERENLRRMASWTPRDRYVDGTVVSDTVEEVSGG